MTFNVEKDVLSIAFLNVNGWTDSNNILRQQIIKALDKEIVCMAESHLLRDKLIHVKNYNCFGYNRAVKHIKSSITYGGVGILVWDSLLKLFTVNIVDKQVDGILGIQLSNKSTGYSCLVYCCYLPPKNRLWAEPYKFFGHLISQLYVSSVETVIICGDFNSKRIRLGQQKPPLV